jgi:hypothetical protein
MTITLRSPAGWSTSSCTYTTRDCGDGWAATYSSTAAAVAGSGTGVTSRPHEPTSGLITAG